MKTYICTRTPYSVLSSGTGELKNGRSAITFYNNILENHIFEYGGELFASTSTVSVYDHSSSLVTQERACNCEINLSRCHDLWQ
mmetsp:Transcript_8366/g.12451  ORF Transcript_8366/g.12451 Transcript_8366/m.12451 type:complete len:84 (-) Transcript_8366:42-293(-)